MIEYNNQTDFKLLEQWNENVDQTAPFVYTYYQLLPRKEFVASFDGKEYINCKRLEDGNILVIFEDHGFAPGKLYCKKQFFLTDEDFKDGICNLVVNYETEVVFKVKSNLNNMATTKMPAFYQKGKDGVGSDGTAADITEIDCGTC